MSRSRNKPPSGSDRDPSTPRTRKPESSTDPAITPDGNASGTGTSNRRNTARAASRDADYAVGYGRPPQQHQFKTGQSGNPRGRPKGVQSEADILTKLLNRKIPIQDHGRTRHISVLEAIYHRIAQNGLKGGDTKSATFLLTRLAAVAQGNSGETPEMNQDDRIVLDTYLAQFMNSQKRGDSK